MASPDDGWRGWNVSGGLRLDTRLSPAASVHVAGRYTYIDGDLDLEALAALAPDGRTALRFHYREKSVWGEYQGDTFAAFSAATGPVRHRLVTGLEAGLSTVESEIGIGPAPSLDIYEPVYGPKPPEPPLTPTGNHLLRLGVYVQDQLQIGTRWSFVPALRWSRLRLEDRAPAANGLTTTDNAFTPSAGLVFLPRPWPSFYASYAEGFEPPVPGQFQEDGRALNPMESRSMELGAKADLLVRRLSVTVAGFRMRQTNVAEADVRGFYRQIGEGESEGLEVEVVGTPTPGLVVRGGYAWTGTGITRDASGFVGRDLPNAPAHKANLWVRYRFPEGAWRRLALGAGVVHVSDRFTTRDNSIRLPAYTRFDANAFCDIVEGRLTLAVAAQNLTDLRYVTSGAGRSFFAGPPRRLAATLTTSF